MHDWNSFEAIWGGGRIALQRNVTLVALTTWNKLLQWASEDTQAMDTHAFHLQFIVHAAQGLGGGGSSFRFQGGNRNFP